MFTYTTIFIGSLIVAVIALVVYRVVMDTSKSILSSKGPVSLISSTTNPRSGESPFAVAGTPGSPGQGSHATPQNIAKTHPAMPPENTDWGWQTKGNQVREQQAHHATGAADTKHCSLYDVDPAAPTDLGDAWPHREEKLEAGGKAYKVTRKVPPQASNDEDSGKPWGW